MFRAVVWMTVCTASLGLNSLLAQDRSTKNDSVLPSAWIGTWEGEVTAESAGGQPAKFQMQLQIARLDQADRLTWKITYRGDQGDSVRDYKIIADPKRVGRFVIDEGNGIQIAATKLGNTLQSHFAVGGQTIWTRYELLSADSDLLEFELISASDNETLASGGQDNIPKVTCLVPAARQFARLARVPAPSTVTTSATSATSATAAAPDVTTWKKLNTEPYRGKQDDIYFVNDKVGWYANGAGKIFKTIDGGETWIKQLEQAGTYFRCLAFIDEQHGFAGNIGPGYFPGVTDDHPLYETKDGGQTWTAVSSIEGPAVVGLCALQVLKEEYINAGKLDHRVRLIGVGRVGGRQR